MKRLILSILGILVVGLIVLAIIAPREFHLERQIVINKPKAVVFNDLKFLKNHEKWNPWARRDPKIVQTYSGTDGTVGSTVAWKGNSEVGVGEEEIKNLKDGERIDLELRFKEPFEGTSTAYLLTEAVDEKSTKVRWGMDGKSPFPANMFCFIMNMGGMMEASFDEGLALLKSNLEK